MFLLEFLTIWLLSFFIYISIILLDWNELYE